MTISAVVPAAGCGARAALNGNKILAPLLGRPLLFWTIRALKSAGIEEIIVVARREEWELVKAAAETEITVVEGGATRQESVFAGVRAARTDFVCVHDAARPCVSTEIVENTFAAARECGAAIVALPASDTVKCADSNGNIVKTLDRREIWLAQTPQIFEREMFGAALSAAQKMGVVGTDCASIVEAVNPGQEIRLVAGHSDNFKVTFPGDLERAAMILGAVNSL